LEIGVRSAFSGKSACLASTGCTFDEAAKELTAPIRTTKVPSHQTVETIASFQENDECARDRRSPHYGLFCDHSSGLPVSQ
jgi:hypothetical protein